MKVGAHMRSDKELPPYHRNLAEMLNENADRFPKHTIYQEMNGDAYSPLSWERFRADVCSIQTYLTGMELEPGDRVAVLSRNRREMLEVELAVMAMGCASVPIFTGYPAERADALVRFCEPRVVFVADEEQYKKLNKPGSYDLVIHFDPIDIQGAANLTAFDVLLADASGDGIIMGSDVFPDDVALMMYTSGTMGKPKCVQLTHRNILSQQAAMRVLWDLNNKDRFLSYLPWHHSFGGIFEKYAAITNGATFSLEDGFGKDIDRLLENWKRVMPTVFFSVPRIYQEITTRAALDRAVEELIFHDELRFIFTAAAALPKNVADVFDERGIPIIEGWGLTETSPCCTVTDPDEERTPGVVGKPIPGVEVALAEDGEILIKGLNVMTGYYRNPEATKKAFVGGGWLRTGDVGKVVPAGLKLISRKDRIFKLSNAEKVVPAEIENMLTSDCAYLAHAYVAGRGRDCPVALLFPNRTMFSQVTDSSNLKEGCECPKNLEEFSHCLKNCLDALNESQEVKYYALGCAMLIDGELSIERDELTPSMKLAPNVIGEIYRANIEQMYGSSEPEAENVYIIRLD